MKLKTFKQMYKTMKTLKDDTDKKIAEDMDISYRHLLGCLDKGKIPYKGIVEWCKTNEVSIDHVMIKDK